MAAMNDLPATLEVQRALVTAGVSVTYSSCA